MLYIQYQLPSLLDLTTSSQHSLSLSYGFWNPASFSSMHLNTNYDYTISPIVYNQKTEIDPDKGLVTISYPENMDNKTQFSSNVWTNFPIIKTKLSLRGNLRYSLTKSPIKINDQLDKTTSNTYNTGIGLSLTPGQKLVFDLRLNGSITDINYSTLTRFDQFYYSYTINSTIQWQFLKNTFFESTFKYYVYKNEKFDFDQKFPVWNASVRRLLGKGNKFEIRLAAFDILNQNLTINQYVNANYFQQTQTNTLTNYYMLSVTYNIKGFENKVEGHGRRFF